VTWDILPGGECGAYIRFGTEISHSTSAAVQAFATALRDLERVEITDVVPGYVSLYIEFDVERATFADIKGIVETIAPKSMERHASDAVLKVPVCYGGEYGPDLAKVAADCEMSEAEVIDIHSSREYEVFFIGFTPGFPFMGIVDERIAVPRLAVPRSKVHAGSVGIAGYQTGVYPVTSPGGWRLIGRTPERLAYLSGPEPRYLLNPGCRVRFSPCDETDFLRLASIASSGD
jgi:inhibitor of KinA